MEAGCLRRTVAARAQPCVQGYLFGLDYKSGNQTIKKRSRVSLVASARLLASQPEVAVQRTATSQKWEIFDGLFWAAVYKLLCLKGLGHAILGNFV